MKEFDHYLRTPAPDDYGIVMYEVFTDGTRRMKGRSFYRPAGRAVSDFYGPGAPLIVSDNWYPEKCTYTILHWHRGKVTYRPVTMEEFKEFFDYKYDLPKETEV